VKIRGERRYLWRAVDQDVIDILVLSVHGVILNFFRFFHPGHFKLTIPFRGQDCGADRR